MRWWPFSRRSSPSRPSDLERAAEDLGERARSGEQNAMAQIVELGEQYRSGRGGPRVKASYETVLRYFESHPVEGRRQTRSGIRLPAPGSRALEQREPPLNHATRQALTTVAGFGCDAPGVSSLASLPALGGLHGVYCAVVLLASGPPMTPEAFLRAKASLPPGEPQDSFQASADDPHSPPRDHFGFAGFVFGRAARLQAVQRGASFALLSPVMAWELGEPTSAAGRE